MKNKDARIYVSSVNNVTKRLQNYGDADIENIGLLKLIYKYACYSSTYSQIQRLDKMVAHLQRVDPYICLEKQARSGSVYDSPTGNVSIGVSGNQAPVASDIAFTVTNETFTITEYLILAGYSDAEGTDSSSMVIKSIPNNGGLLFQDVQVTVGQVIDLTGGIVFLRYVRNSNSAYQSSFTYSLYDGDSQLALESNIATAAITVSAIVVENEAPTVGNRTIYADNRITTVFSSADFTSQAIAPYFDPEGDDLDAIIIRDISVVNGGIYYFYGTQLVVGQIITKAELDSGAFYHVGSDSNAIATDTFRAAVRDTGSMIWVE